MRNKLRTLIAVLSCFILLQRAEAQCLTYISSNTVVVNTPDTVNGGFDPLWVCSGVTLVSDGGFHNIYLEPFSVMTTGGGIDSIFVKKFATFSMNGGIHVVVYEQGAILNLNGGISTPILCPAVHFDYTQAPPAGCHSTTTIEEHKADNEAFTISPNPSSGLVRLSTAGEFQSIEIFNVLGSRVLSNQLNDSNIDIDLRSFPRGLYQVKLTANGKSSSRKLVLE